MKWIYTNDSENVTLALDSIESEFSIPYNNENFNKPKINLETLEIYEGATMEELQEIENKKYKNYKVKIYEKTARLLKSALERAVGKEGQGLDLIELENLQKTYEIKKQDAQNIINDLPINEIAMNTLIFEIENDFKNGKLDATINFINQNYGSAIDINLSPIKKYASLILFKYFAGYETFETFKRLIENFRSRLLTNLTNKEYSRIDARFELVNGIDTQTTKEEILEINNQFNAI